MPSKAIRKLQLHRGLELPPRDESACWQSRGGIKDGPLESRASTNTLYQHSIILQPLHSSKASTFCLNFRAMRRGEITLGAVLRVLMMYTAQPHYPGRRPISALPGRPNVGFAGGPEP